MMKHIKDAKNISNLVISSIVLATDVRLRIFKRYVRGNKELIR